jgi:ribosomal protein S18 acetylase RimI-like enzyme
MDQPRNESEIVVRPFEPGDYDAVLALWQEGRLPLKPDGRDSRKAILDQVRQPQVIFLVAERNGRVVGTVLATHDGRKGWINRLAVDSGLRRRGIGRRLVFEAERRFSALGLHIFACLIEDGNDVSMELFERLGYTKHPEIIYFAKREFPGA